MFQLDYEKVYKAPKSYFPPDEKDLKNNTDYANLNSRDYSIRPTNHLTRMHNIWECFSLNSLNHPVIATNKLSGRDWSGSLWGFETCDDLSPQNACFKLQCRSFVTHIQYVSTNIFIVTMASGLVQLWSTYSEVRNPNNPYCLFLINGKNKHINAVSCLEVMKSNSNKAITGDRSGCLKLWDMGCADLLSEGGYGSAHTDVCTSVSSSYSEQSVFMTCGRDKNCLLWDLRSPKPCQALYQHYDRNFMSVTSTDHNENTVFIGDEYGFLHTLDKRVPNKFVESKQYFIEPIRKVVPNGENLAVIADTNVVKVSKLLDHKIFYVNKESKNFVRDCAWREPTELLTTGYDGKMHLHKIV